MGKPQHADDSPPERRNRQRSELGDSSIEILTSTVSSMPHASRLAASCRHARRRTPDDATGHRASIPRTTPQRQFAALPIAAVLHPLPPPCSALRNPRNRCVQKPRRLASIRHRGASIHDGPSHPRAARFGIVPFLGCLGVAWVAGVVSTPILTSNPSLALYFCHRELTVVGAGQELRVQERGKDCVPGLGIETEQALGLRRGELETGHLAVFCTDSVQQFCR
jgi:hypothetical protein